MTDHDDPAPTPRSRPPVSTDWRVLSGRSHTRFRTGDFVTGLALVNRIGDAGRGGEPPSRRRPALPARGRHAVQPRRRRVSPRATSTWPGGSATPRGELGVGPTPRLVRCWRSRLDTADHDAIKPFWRAVLGWATSPETDTRCSTPRARCRRCGSSTRSRTTSRGSASTSTSGCRPRWRASGSPRRSRPAGRWSPTSSARGSGCSPTPRATRRALTTGRGARLRPARQVTETGVPDAGTPGTLA